MGNDLNNPRKLNSPEIDRAALEVDRLTNKLGGLAKEAALLGASNIPVVGTVVDVGQAVWNIWSGNWGAAALDIAGAIPGAGDAAKTAIRGTKIAKATARAGKLLDTAKSRLTLARRQAASKKYLKRVKNQRDAIKKKYKDCKKKECMDARDKELRSKDGGAGLPAKEKGDFVDPKTGKRVPAGEGVFVPKTPPPQNNLHDAFTKHQKNGEPLGIPYKDGQPDFTGFPPKNAKGDLYNPQLGNQAPQVDIEQAMGSNARNNRKLDRKAAEDAYKDKYKTDTLPVRGEWHHNKNGTGMDYVDEDLHTALSHNGAQKMNQSPEF